MSQQLRVIAATALTMAACSTGCYLGGTARVRPPAIDPARAGSGAIRQYDTNEDGIIQNEELERAPALKAAVRQLDTDRDGGISADEIAARVRAWQASQVGRMSLGCLVTYKGRALAGATVTFEPEKFLGSEIRPCSGLSDESGIVILSVAPQGNDDVQGADCGLYLVRISKQVGGKEIVPARYNSATTLGEEVAIDAAGLQKGMLRFDLSGP